MSLLQNNFKALIYYVRQMNLKGSKFGTNKAHPNPYLRMNDDFEASQSTPQDSLPSRNINKIDEEAEYNPFFQQIIDDILGLSEKKDSQMSETSKKVNHQIRLKVDLSPPPSSPQQEQQLFFGADIDNHKLVQILSEQEPAIIDQQKIVLLEPQPKTKSRAHPAKIKRPKSTHDRRGRIPKNATSQKKIKKFKKDVRKNSYGYSFKFIVKQFLSERYKQVCYKLCYKSGDTDVQKVREYYEEKLNWSISLKNIRQFLTFNNDIDQKPLKAVKQAFHRFYVWYMRKRYILHILTQDKIIHKDAYIQAKNYLIYLPDIKPKDKSKTLRPSEG